MKKIINRLVLYSREKLRCIKEPRYIVIDSISIKTHNRFEKIWFDGYKKIKSVKIQLAEDEYRHILAIDIHKANIHDTKREIKVIGDAF